MSNCPFCTEPHIQERTIASNADAFAFLTNIPITPGHTLVCPKRCVAKLDDMTDEERNAILALRHVLANALKSTMGAEGFNYAWNENSIAGQSVPHFHLHVVPRMTGDTGITEYEPRRFLYRPGSRATSPEDELSDITQQIRDAL